jgi:hypothetical protein
MKTGFAFDETMTGTMERVDRPGEQVHFTFSVQVRAPSMLQHVRDGKATMRGTIEAPGLATRADAEGTMTLRPVFARVVKYELAFTGDDGKRYRFAGQKDIRWLRALRTWTTLPGEITDESGRLVARVQTRFDYKSDWMQFASSWRPA